MCANHDKTSLVAGIIKMKCPNCRKGQAFKNKSAFPLRESQTFNERCSVCGQKMVHETNNGPGINYALTVIIFFLNLAWYIPIFGISFMDNSLYYYMAASIFVVFLIQPWTMRYSRILYLYAFVPYQSNKHLKKS